MIFGIGVDLVNQSRIEIVFQKHAQRLIKKILSSVEMEQMIPLETKNHHYIKLITKKFAATESLSKAMGTGIGKYCKFHDVHLTRDKLGKPIMEISGDTAKYLSKFGAYKINLSFSDEIIESTKLIICNLIIEI